MQPDILNSDLFEINFPMEYTAPSLSLSALLQESDSAEELKILHLGADSVGGSLCENSGENIHFTFG